MCRRAAYSDGSAQMWGDTNTAVFTQLEGGNDSGIELMYLFDEARKLTGGVITIGNGFNDIQMSDAADLSICVMGKEGCCGALLTHCDVVVTSIDDALDLLLKTGRLRATLRT
jgi:soluble P-type ATPase